MSITKRGKSWRSSIMVAGVRYTGTFDTKRQAERWENEKRGELNNNIKRPTGATMGDLLDRYAREVSPSKKGSRWEQIRISAFLKTDLADLPLHSLDSPDIVRWRDNRCRQVAKATVKREMVLLGHACEVARREWKWLTTNPFTDVKKPTAPRHRDRIITDTERDAIVAALGLQEGGSVTRPGHRVALVFLFALETAMRSGEICALHQSDITGRVALVRDSKNGQARRVPLSTRALQIVDQAQNRKRNEEENDNTVFGISDQSRDVLFRRAVKRAGITGLTFHDSRHTATTRLARVFSEKGLSVLDLARVTGHTDLRQLLIYFNVTAEDLAARLD